MKLSEITKSLSPEEKAKLEIWKKQQKKYWMIVTACIIGITGMFFLNVATGCNP